MIEETAAVLDTQGELAWVETRRQSSCGACAASKGCGTALLGQVFGARRARLRVLNRIGAKSGDLVVVGVAEQALVRGSLAVYLLPLLGLMGGGMFGVWLANTLAWTTTVDGSSVLCGIAGLALGLAWVRRWTAGMADDARYQAVILRKGNADCI